MREAWVTYAEAGFFPLLRVLLRSLAAFSSRPVLVYSIRATFDASGFGNVADVRRLEGHDHIWTHKLIVLADAAPRADLSIFLDADTVVNYTVDELWSWHARYSQRSDLPLLPAHTVQTDNAVAVKFAALCGETINRPFGCTTPVWFTPACLQALREAVTVKQQAEKLWTEVGDGEAVNAVLSRRGYTVNAPLCTPNYHSVDRYLHQQPSDAMGEAAEGYYHLFHGCKDPDEAGQILDTLLRPRLPVHYARPA